MRPSKGLTAARNEAVLLAPNETVHRFRGIPGDDYGRYLAKCGQVIAGWCLSLEDLDGERLCGRCFTAR